MANKNWHQIGEEYTKALAESMRRTAEQLSFTLGGQIMGYRSDVAYSIHFENKDTLNQFIALVMVKGGEEVKALKECQIECNEISEVFKVNFTAYDVKWYESYPDVQSHTWLMEFAVERFPEHCGYEFVRIGEESNDIEEQQGGMMDNFNYRIYVRRVLELDFSGDAIGDALAIIP